MESQEVCIACCRCGHWAEHDAQRPRQGQSLQQLLHAQCLACLQHAAKKIVVSETVQLLHGLTFQAFSKCKKVHQDVYQRFSGYVARHRLAQFCEGILGILENLQDRDG
eukprot:s8525_g1.t1